jgi:prevent-host-death family protein
MTKAYSVYEAKAKLSEILRLVKAGKEVIINERGHPVARVLPFMEVTDLEERWQNFIANGQIQRATNKASFAITEMKKGALDTFLKERD